LNKVTRRKKNDDNEGKAAGMSLQDQEVGKMDKFLKNIEKHNQIIDN